MSAPPTATGSSDPGTTRRGESKTKRRAGTDKAQPHDTAPAGPAGPPVRMRRSPVRMGLGVALIAVGGLGGAYLASQGGQSHEIVVLRNTVDAGEKITRADLATRSVSSSSQITGVPADNMAAVIDRYATGNLPAGTVLVPGMASTTFSPTTGQSVIGISVKTSQRPAAGLQAGQRVRLVMGSPASGGGAPAGQQPGQLPGGITVGQAWPAQIAAIGQPNDDQTVTVDVTVGTDTATQIATAASTGGVSIVLEPARGAS